MHCLDLGEKAKAAAKAKYCSRDLIESTDKSSYGLFHLHSNFAGTLMYSR